jgi:hypothetical protein
MSLLTADPVTVLPDQREVLEQLVRTSSEARADRAIAIAKTRFISALLQSTMPGSPVPPDAHPLSIIPPSSAKPISALSASALQMPELSCELPLLFHKLPPLHNAVNAMCGQSR